MSVPCLWCSCVFKPRQDGGSQQRFCSPGCRQALNTAARRWALDQVDAGILLVDDLRKYGVSADRRGTLHSNGAPAQAEHSCEKGS